jgi:two-component system, cell cycle response regulator
MHAAVVDSSRVVLKLITKLLAERGDSTSEFLDSDAALRRIKADPSIDVLITSLEVQPMSGLELCWETRLAIPAQRPLYIVVMSSLSDETKLAEALDCGADELIAKPVKKLELYARLRMAGRLKAAQLHLVRLAETDPLTALFNRRAFFERLNDRLRQPHLAATLSAILLDIDHFKRINDAYGHDAGDMVIKGVANETMKISNIAGRLGGEEYGIILEGCPENRVLKLSESLRKSCSEIQFTTGNETFSVTCSLGVSRWAPGDTADDLLKKADVALYRAKADGRNRVHGLIYNLPAVERIGSSGAITRQPRAAP